LSQKLKIILTKENEETKKKILDELKSIIKEIKNQI
jgi:hypothetical protein